MRRTPIERRTPLKRGNKPLVRIRPERRAQKRGYNVDRLEYLADHPFCQVSIFLAGLDERAVIAAGGSGMPASTQIHHRNKARGPRLNDQRFWMAASQQGHDLVEGRKEYARSVGLLLPFEADANGLCPNGVQCLTTPELMDSARI